MEDQQGMTALEKDERKEMSDSNKRSLKFWAQDSNLTEIRRKSYYFFSNCFES